MEGFTQKPISVSYRFHLVFLQLLVPLRDAIYSNLD